MSVNILLKNRRTGTCVELKGNVRLHFVLVYEPGISWTAAELNEIKNSQNKLFEKLYIEAAKDNVKLKLFASRDTMKLDHRLSGEEALRIGDEYAKQFGQKSLTEMHREVKKVNTIDQNAFIFYIKRDKRSFASISRQYDPILPYSEFAVIFETDLNTLMHETLHLFGAADLYYPTIVREKAELFFPNSVMLCNGEYIDSLTRYLIGWRSTLTPQAQKLIDVASSISIEELEEQKRKQWNSDYTVIESGTGTYYGPTKDGLYCGKGKLVFKDGTVYIGDFVDGTFCGFGKLTTKDGVSYLGDFRDGLFHGEGRYTYQDGSTLTGHFVKGQCEGRATLRFAGSGMVYIGEFRHFRKHGHGIYYYPDGTVFEGEFENDEQCGRGEYRYKNGRVLKGRFVNGEFIQDN